MPCRKFSQVFDSVNSIKFMMVHLLLHKICHLNDNKENNSFENEQEVQEYDYKIAFKRFPHIGAKLQVEFYSIFFTPASLKRNENKTSISRVFTVGQFYGLKTKPMINAFSLKCQKGFRVGSKVIIQTKIKTTFSHLEK